MSVLDETINDIGRESTPMLANTPLNALFFADDLASFSLSKERLEDKLNLLEKYCRDWGLEANSKRTKIIIFYKQVTLIKNSNLTTKAQKLIWLINPVI